MKDSCVIYLHGTLGSFKEAEEYYFLSDKYDVIGLDYSDGNPWEIKDHVINEFKRITSGYKHINVIGASFGAFLCIRYLYDLKIEKAFFYSPLVDINELTDRMMKHYGVTMDDLKKNEIIHLAPGKTISYSYYEENKQKDKWNVETFILYGENDCVITRSTVEKFAQEHHSKLVIESNAPHWFKETKHIEDKKQHLLSFFK